MRNKEIVERFLYHNDVVSNSTGSLSSTGDCLYSYQTCIAEFDKGGRLWFNKTKYSCTTSHHQTLVSRQASIYKEVDNIPRGSKHIVQSIEEII